MSKKLLFTLIILSLLAFIFSDRVKGEIIIQIACKVNGQAITDFEIKALVSAYMKELGKYYDVNSDEYMKLSASVLESLINDILLYQAADMDGIRVPNEFINEELERIKESVGAKTEEELVELLRKENLTLGALIDNLRRRYTVQFYTQRRLEAPVITDAEALKYYEDNKENFVKEEQLSISIITLEPDPENADYVYSLILDNGDFESIATQYSTHLSTKHNGGFIGLVDTSNLNEAFIEAMKDADSGYVTEPFIHEGSYVILKVNEVFPKSYIDFSELRDRIVTYLYNYELEKKYSELLQGLRKEAVIEFSMPFYEKAMERFGGENEL